MVVVGADRTNEFSFGMFFFGCALFLHVLEKSSVGNSSVAEKFPSHRRVELVGWFEGYYLLHFCYFIFIYIYKRARRPSTKRENVDPSTFGGICERFQ